MLTLEQIHDRLKAEYPYGINLRYVDYRDSLDENPDMIKAVIESDHDYINEQIYKWYDDGETETISEVMREVFTEEERHQQDIRDDVSQRCRDHDNEDPMKQLIRNSHEPLCYYDTGYEFPDPDGYTGEEMLSFCVEACRTIGIHTKYAKTLKSLYNNAYYGGSLVFIVNLDLADLYSAVTTPKYINFGNTTVGIIHFGNGSGDYGSICLSKKQISFPYEPDRLIVDDTEKYGIQAIFGCFRDIGGSVGFSDTRPKKCTKGRLPLSSEAVARQKEEAEFKKIYSAGSCSYLDRDISRHRKAFYTNDVPCGTKCPDCGRFRID